MECEIRDQGEAAVLVLSGDVDLESSPGVRKALLDCVGMKSIVVVDMAGVSYIDSSGVASLVEAFQAARKRDTRFVLARVSKAAMRVLELARLDRVFTVVSEVSDGLGHGD